MNIKDEDMEWETEALHLASLPKTTPYSVPDYYFNDLQSRINQSVFVANLLQKENHGFVVPQNYFEELDTNIEAKIATDQIKTLVNHDGFKTPTNYFDQLNTEILNKTSQPRPKTKILRLWNSNLMKYASAACVVLMAAAGLYFNQQNPLKQDFTTEIASEQMLYDIDESVIIEHLQETQNVTNSSLSDKEMENYILENYSSSDLSNNL